MRSAGSFYAGCRGSKTGQAHPLKLRDKRGGTTTVHAVMDPSIAGAGRPCADLATLLPSQCAPIASPALFAQSVYFRHPRAPKAL